MREARVVQEIAQQQQKHLMDSGIVRAVRGQYIDIILDGTKKQLKDVILSTNITSVQPGWWVVIVRPPITNKWVAIVAVETVTFGSKVEPNTLLAPSGVTATGKQNLIELFWYGSFSVVATYEVQHNSSATETGATTLKVAGSNFLYWCSPGTTRYFRVRAVAADYERSSWSAWVNATSESGFLHYQANGVAGVAVTVISDGTYDVTSRLNANCLVEEVAGGGTSDVIVWLSPSDESYPIYDDGVDTLTLAVAANGSVTVQRTAGADTFNVSLLLHWM